MYSMLWRTMKATKLFLRNRRRVPCQKKFRDAFVKRFISTPIINHVQPCPIKHRITKGYIKIEPSTTKEPCIIGVD